MWLEENKVGGLLICRVVLNERGGFSLTPEQIFAQKCHDLGVDRFSVIARIISFIVSEMEDGKKTEVVKITGFEQIGYVSSADMICGAPREPERINIMVEGKDLEQTIKGEPVKILIRTNVGSEGRFKDVLKIIGKA